MKYGIICLIFFLFVGGASAQQSGGGAGEPLLKLPRTGQISTFDNTGKRVNYLGSQQDGELQHGEVWPEPRFFVNTDGTVTDNLTGMMWLKDGNCFGKVPWNAAFKKIQELNKSNADCLDYRAVYDDWTVANLNELATLVNAEEALPADYLKLQGIANVQLGGYWSSTAAVNLFNAWIVDLSNGNIIFQSKISKHYILPVRMSGPGKINILQTGQKKSSAQGDDGEKRHGIGWSGSRFSDNEDGTITDNLTGLMWLQDASCLAGLDWLEALQATDKLNTSPLASGCRNYSNNYSDWSLPNRVELRSLVDYSLDYPAVSAGDSFYRPESWFWSATTSVGSPGKSFAVNFDEATLRAKPKTEKLRAIAVRRTRKTPLAPRKESTKGPGINVDEQYILSLAPELHREIHWPPEPRFFENGDGTSLDTITGTNWLTDGNCFGRLSWKDLSVKLREFNRDARRFECLGYESNYDDWQVPTLEDMKELLNDKEKDTAAWLNSQGVENVQSGSDYWTATETVVNLYFAYVVNLKHGKISSYPKTFGFFLWPKRVSQQESDRMPLLGLTINGLSEFMSLSSEAPMSFVLYLHTFGLRLPADFWLWYETPDGSQVWLSSIRTWKDTMSPIYQGDLFNLRNYEVYKSSLNDLAPGEYTFHFAVDTQQNGILDELRYESLARVTIY